MGFEIERKFLVNDGFFIKTLGYPEFIWQTYLLSDESRSVRIRKKGEKAFITFKSGKNLLKRKEFEYEIPLEDFMELKKNFNDFPFIEKNRYLFKGTDMDWEIDVFSGTNKGLILAEIELETEFQKFKNPEWLGKEVTNDPKYLNVNLAKHPYSSWEKKI